MTTWRVHRVGGDGFTDTVEADDMLVLGDGTLMFVSDDGGVRPPKMYYAAGTWWKAESEGFPDRRTP